MNRGKNFIDRTIFEDVLGKIDTARGSKYQDFGTIYGDMSRLVVAIIATTPPQKLQEMYNELGWGGAANVRAMHKAAEHWYRTYHPGRSQQALSDAGAEPGVPADLAQTAAQGR